MTEDSQSTNSPTCSVDPVDRVLKALGGRCFETLAQLEHALCQEFDRRLFDFSKHYEPGDLLDFAAHQGYVRRDDKGRLWVVYDAQDADPLIRFAVQLDIEVIARTPQDALRRVRHLLDSALQGSPCVVSVVSVKRLTPRSPSI